MFYDVGSITNRNIQLLYEYRILREPSENLTAICRDSTPQISNDLAWSVSSRIIDGYDVVYEATLSGVTPEKNCVPFIEFHPDKDVDWKWIADFIDVEVDGDVVKLYSTTNYLESISMSVYWCYSLRHIDTMLSDILKDLDRLIKEYDQLEKEIRNFKDTGRYLKRPEGLIPNLVKIENVPEGSNLVDSLYKIMTAESNRLFVNMTQDNLNHMEHIFNEAVEFRFINKDHYVVDDIIAPIILISGHGDLVLKNIRGQVLVRRWYGTITVIDCPEVHLTAAHSGDICKLTKLQISKGSTVYLENQIHLINELSMFADSICRHWRANVKSLSYVGPGCTYWCSAQVAVPGRVQLANYSEDDPCNTVYDFNMHDIIGAFISDFNDIMIAGFKNLTPRLGNSDAEPQPGMYVSKWKAKYNSYIAGGAGKGYFLLDPCSTALYYHPLGEFAQHYIDGDVGFNVLPHTYGSPPSGHGWGKLDWGVPPDIPVYSMTNGTITSVNCRTDSSQYGYAVVIKTDRVDSVGKEIYIRYLEMAGLGEIAAKIAGRNISPGPNTFNLDASKGDVSEDFTEPCDVPIKQGDLIGYTNSFYSDYSDLHLDFHYYDNYRLGMDPTFYSPEVVPHVTDGATLNPAFEIRSGLVYCNGERLGTENGLVLDRSGSETGYTVYPIVSFMVCLQKPIRKD